MKIETLRDLYLEQLHDLYSAETQLVPPGRVRAMVSSHSVMKHESCRM